MLRRRCWRLDSSSARRAAHVSFKPWPYASSVEDVAAGQLGDGVLLREARKADGAAEATVFLLCVCLQLLARSHIAVAASVQVVDRGIGAVTAGLLSCRPHFFSVSLVLKLEDDDQLNWHVLFVILIGSGMLLQVTVTSTGRVNIKIWRQLWAKDSLLFLVAQACSFHKKLF